MMRSMLNLDNRKIKTKKTFQIMIVMHLNKIISKQEGKK